MGEDSNIEWTDHTFNPWIGCTKVSPGCDNCYAEKLATQRLGVAWGPHAERRFAAESTWHHPARWNRKAQKEGRRARVFCASLADVFDNQVPDQWRLDLWHLIHQTPHLDWLLLTKRPQNIAAMLPQPATLGFPAWGEGWPNVWLGTTVESQAEADRRIPHLLSVPARVRFLSCEPLLGPVNLRGWETFDHGWHSRPGEDTPRIDWVIAGGESGHGARPMHPDWARSLRDQCQAAGVPFFFKQWGDWREWNHGSADDEVDADSEEAAVILASAHRPGWVTRDGTFYQRLADLPDGAPCRLMEQVGKRAAGATLDGRDWREVPHAE